MVMLLIWKKNVVDIIKDIENNPIDIQILGIGMDGHIAYNEPGSPFDGGSHVVDLHQESIQSSLDYGFDRMKMFQRKVSLKELRQS